MAGTIKLPHTCPKCGERAHTAQELQQKFGYRTISPNSVTNQSYCKKCISK